MGIASEVLVHGSRKGYGVEGRVGHRVVHLTADDVVLPPPDLTPLDHPRPERRVQVSGEGVGRLVVVVVAVEHGMIDLVEVTHRSSPSQR